MKTIQGPAIFLARFMGEQAPFEALSGAATAQLRSLLGTGS